MNWLVFFTGGRNGLFGAWYEPSAQEHIVERLRSLEREKMRIEMAEEDARLVVAKNEKSIKKAYAKGQHQVVEALHADASRKELDLKRLGVQYSILTREIDAMERLRIGTTVQESVLARSKILRERFEQAPPHVVRQAFKQIAFVQEHEEMFLDSLESTYSEEEERINDKHADLTQERAETLEGRLERLGLVASPLALPDVPAVALPNRDLEGD
jgi:predicted kinase